MPSRPKVTVVKAPTSAVTRNGIFILNTREVEKGYRPLGEPHMTSLPKESWSGLHYDTNASENALRMVTYGSKPGPGTVVANVDKLTQKNFQKIINAGVVDAKKTIARMKSASKIKSKKNYPSGLYTNLHLQPYEVLMFQGNATPHGFPVRKQNQKYTIYFGNYRNRGKSSLNKLKLATGYNWKLDELKKLENLFRAQRTPAINNNNNNL